MGRYNGSLREDGIILVAGYLLGTAATEALTMLQRLISISPAGPAPTPSAEHLLLSAVDGFIQFGPFSAVMAAAIFVIARSLRGRIHYPWLFSGLITGTLLHVSRIVLWGSSGAGMAQIEQFSVILGTGLYPALFIGTAAELIARHRTSESGSADS